MSDNLTNTAEDLVLVWLSGTGTATRPTAPIKLRLCTSTPTDAAAGTEVTGGSYPAGGVNAQLDSAGKTNTADISFTGMPACTVTHGELWDSAGTPVRIWWGALGASKTVSAGDTFTVLAGDLDIALT